MSIDRAFTKDNLENYLKELGKEFRKRNGTKMTAEIILVGGAAILANYGFREMTYDIDAVITASSTMKEAINAVGDKFQLPNRWLNADFQNTNSYTPKLRQYSKHYRIYSNVLHIRTVRAEYLVAMKLVSGRSYKKDLSDVVGILYEQKKEGQPLDYEKIDRAVQELYGNWNDISEYAKQFLETALASENLPELFEEQMKEEETSQQILLRAERKTEQKITEDSAEDIIRKALEKRKNDRDAR
ncbi:MAG: DUF6036 family nucleotidyltransferase [Roseburia sp.]|nr:DUF6036 family nucleotidyltransferase [Roseburia sp.]